MQTKQTAQFAKWLNGLKDLRAVRAIRIRIARIEAGLLGDVKFFGGIGELRVNMGPGYRVYFVKRGEELVILLCGGDKGSQDRDIAKAKEMAADLE
jgi:putative addiction module killer protein